MARKALGLMDYVKAAFHVRPTIKGLGDVPINYLYLLGVGVLGLLNPGFWVIGLGLEVGFLAYLSHDPRFRKWLDAIQKAGESGDWESRKQALLSGLEARQRKRYMALEERCRQLLQADPLSNKVGSAPEEALQSSVVNGLNRLLVIFLQLLVRLHVLEVNTQAIDRTQLQREIEGYERNLKELAGDETRERLARSLEGTLDIARKRLANLDTALANIQFIYAELLRIEQQVALMIQEAALARDPGALSMRVDAVATTLNETTEWMKAQAATLGPIEDDLEPPPAAPMVGA